MESKHIFLIVRSLFILLASFFPQQVSSLESIQVATLPVPLFLMTPFYDGQSDNIYLFGGQTTDFFPNYDILSFSLTNQTVEKVGQIPEDVPIGFDTIPIFPASNGSHLYYLVTDTSQVSTSIFRFDPVDGFSVRVGNLPVALSISGYTKAPNGDFYVFGGEHLQNMILKLDLESETIKMEIVGNLLQRFDFAVAATVGNTAFIFGNSIRVSNPLNLITLNLETLESFDPQLNVPFLESYPSVTATNRGEVFLIGGYSAGGLVEGLLRINATTPNLDYLPVDNFPLSPGFDFLIAPATVFVDKLNRIYFFGGLQRNFAITEAFNTIWYIDLNDLPN